MRSCAGRGREAEEAAAVARTTTLAPVTVDGSLELTWGAESFPLALKRVQVFHVPSEENTHITQSNTLDHHKNIPIPIQTHWLNQAQKTLPQPV